MCSLYACEGGLASESVNPNEGSMACVPVRPIIGDLASVPFMPVSCSKWGVASDLSILVKEVWPPCLSSPVKGHGLSANMPNLFHKNL